MKLLHEYKIANANPSTKEIQETFLDEENDNMPWKKPIYTDELLYAVHQANLPLHAAFSQTYRCQYCHSVVINDICTECMIDWND